MTDSGISGVLTIVQKAAKPFYNLVKITGPFLIAQSKTAVENYSDFKLNKARLEAISALLQEEVKNISAERATLRDKITNSTGLERVRAQNDYDLLTKEINKLSTVDKIKDFIGDNESIDESLEIDDNWIYIFNQLASSLNEEWRKQLLAKAFSLELKKPGAINLHTLNCIASFDEETFRIFGFLVNSSIRLYEVNFLPALSEEKTFKINENKFNIDNIEYKLGHLNLLNFNFGYVKIENKDIYMRYGRRVLKIRRPESPSFQGPNGNIGAIFFTPLGNSIATLYTRHLNDFGNDNFESLLSEAKKHRYIFQEIEISEQLYSELGN
ncbi:DUF2806 domain-containing protein [Klebsiella pneumoniae]|uniref:DUF2806 domain-containing protein n=1 Tax=Klebsiella pneumoniae TaxID=573 RepID=UPI001CF616B6|nr:DUF2806 domain-containing protein [Klebsiella pneumoniae]MCB3676376.1 DUF2806 domain-containing protein [Klebsiella pneumoniae]MCB3735985.1 DUF2806 domain-containing protein [Klebsiella pneumoniae]MCQ0487119.1 DUF2806 domain-containing protein [Klebsiella pneumoniae]MCQ0492630.1 DUF2806 domain-containing protein [Klebsiella pneumoniae]